MSASHARIASLWRYPVSSMAGERLDGVELGQDGFEGDRTWGVRDVSADRIAYPGREARANLVPRGHARLDRWGALEVSVDGKAWGPVEALTPALSELFGFSADIRSYGASGGFQPRYNRAPLHLLTTASLRTLQRALPASVIDERRFRPNIVVDVADGTEPIPESEWIGRDIRIGNVVLRGRDPCARCGFTMLEQDGLPLDAEVLRLITKQFGRNFGIYCEVMAVGKLQLGDAVMVEDVDH